MNNPIKNYEIIALFLLLLRTCMCAEDKRDPAVNGRYQQHNARNANKRKINVSRFRRGRLKGKGNGKGKGKGNQFTTLVPSETPSHSPSQRPSLTVNDCASPSGRNEDINMIFSNVINSLQPNIPQQRALDFIVNDTNFNACSGPDDLIERYTLALFYYSARGYQWKNNRGWLSGVNHCDNGWYGITCAPEGGVEQIKLQMNNLNGVIPAEIADLNSLSRLRLFDNSLEGTVPSEIYSLNSLSLIDLEKNYLSGDLFPLQLFNATTMTRLRMSNNKFSGTIPPDISKLNALEQLWFANNDITGSIPTEITELTSMQRMIFYGNKLTGVIPHNIGAMTELDWIDLSVTNINGSIPPSIGNLKKLQILIMQSMSLTGTLPLTISNLVNLREFLVENNKFEGYIPDLSNLPALKKLVLFNNTLSGTISTVGPNLAYIDVRQNSLSGTIPDALFSANNSTLQRAYFSNNTFSGPIPPSYPKVTSLVDLWLDGNDLTGTIPDLDEGDLPAITEILFDENRLSGSVPDGICDLISAIPEQFVSLHADCYPKPGTDIPNNPCSITCCTDCSVGN